MTEREIATGKRIFQKVRNVYEAHPEYKSLNKHMDRYERFVTEMMEKYGSSRSNIVGQIHGGVLVDDWRYEVKDYHKKRQEL